MAMQCPGWNGFRHSVEERAGDDGIADEPRGAGRCRVNRGPTGLGPDGNLQEDTHERVDRAPGGADNVEQRVLRASEDHAASHGKGVPPGWAKTRRKESPTKALVSRTAKRDWGSLG